MSTQRAVSRSDTSTAILSLALRATQFYSAGARSCNLKPWLHSNMILVRLLKDLQELRHRWIWAQGAGFGNCSPFSLFPLSCSPGAGCSAVPSHRPTQPFCFTSAHPPLKCKGIAGMSNSSPKVRDTIHNNITFQRVFIHRSWNQLNLISVFCCSPRQMTVM